MSAGRKVREAFIPGRGDVVGLALAFALLQWIGWWALVVFPAVLMLDALVEGIAQGVREALRSGGKSHARPR